MKNSQSPQGVHEHSISPTSAITLLKNELGLAKEQSLFTTTADDGGYELEYRASLLMVREDEGEDDDDADDDGNYYIIIVPPPCGFVL